MTDFNFLVVFLMVFHYIPVATRVEKCKEWENLLKSSVLLFLSKKERRFILFEIIIMISNIDNDKKVLKVN